MEIRYGDIMIASLDQIFIDKLSEELDVDYYDIDVYIDSTDKHIGVSITNQLIYSIYRQFITDLDQLPEKYKEKLIDSIRTNSLDSGIVGEIDDYPKKYHKQIEILF